jgi:isopenicillin-N N-acyltransferase-like protein
MGWPIVHASGGPRERGRAYGAAARDRVHGSIELYGAVFEHYTGLTWGQVRARAGAFVEWFDDTDVQLLPEIEGIAEGAGVDAEDVLALNLRTEVMFGLDARAARAAAECTALGVAPPASDGVLVAQTWDWKPAAADTCVLLAMRPTGRPGFVTLVEAGLLAKAGMNDAGIGLATNALTSSLDRGEPGVPYHAILRRILSTASLEEAVREVAGRHRASSANYVIGTRRGEVVDIEVAPGDADAAWRIDGPAVCHANHFERPDRPFKDLAALEGPDSSLRAASVRGSLAASPVDVAAVQDALRAHMSEGHGDGSVCSHGDPALPPVADYVTIAGLVMDLTAGELHLTQGPPCSSDFETFGLPQLLAAA